MIVNTWLFSTLFSSIAIFFILFIIRRIDASRNNWSRFDATKGATVILMIIDLTLASIRNVF